MSAFETLRDLMDRWTPHRQGLLKAIELLGGTHDEDDVLLAIFGGRAKLLTSEKTAAVIEVVSYPKFKSLNVFLLAGELLDVIAQEPRLESEARALGCKRIEFSGRNEWRQTMKDRPDGFTGFVARGAAFYKDL